jgi:hypothetical protein
LETSLFDTAKLFAKELAPEMDAFDFCGYIVTDKDHNVILASEFEPVVKVVSQHDEFLMRVLEGNATVNPPFANVAAVETASGKIQTGAPTMLAGAPIRAAVCHNI